MRFAFFLKDLSGAFFILTRI